MGLQGCGRRAPGSRRRAELWGCRHLGGTGGRCGDVMTGGTALVTGTKNLAPGAKHLVHLGAGVSSNPAVPRSVRSVGEAKPFRLPACLGGASPRVAAARRTLGYGRMSLQEMAGPGLSRGMALGRGTCQWSIQMVLWRLYGHNGRYSNRLKTRPLGGIELVPWAPPPTVAPCPSFGPSRRCVASISLENVDLDLFLSQHVHWLTLSVKCIALQCLLDRFSPPIPPQEQSQCGPWRTPKRTFCVSRSSLPGRSLW